MNEGSPEEGVRLNVCLPLSVARVTTGSVERRRTAVLTGPRMAEPSSSLPYRHDPSNALEHLVARVEALEAKIDQLLSLVLRDQQRESREAGISMELHGSGLKFRWPEAVPVDQVLEIALTLNLLPASEIFFLAQVTGCELEPEDQAGGETQQYLVEAKFTTIREEHLDAIHRFIFTTQRQGRRASSNT